MGCWFTAEGALWLWLCATAQAQDLLGFKIELQLAVKVVFNRKLVDLLVTSGSEDVSSNGGADVLFLGLGRLGSVWSATAPSAVRGQVGSGAR